jgi:hypothetical protein
MELERRVANRLVLLNIGKKINSYNFCFPGMERARLMVIQSILLTAKSNKMKRTIFFSIVLSALSLSGRLHAQDSKIQPGVAFTQGFGESTTDAPSPGVSTYHPLAVSSINARAIRDFKSRYAKVADGQWSKLDKGFCVTFSKDSARTRAFYDDKGRWQASVIYCDETKLPFFVRDMVRRAYYDLPITCVNILEADGGTVYLVHVEDKKLCKIVRVTQEGDMDVLS